MQEEIRPWYDTPLHCLNNNSYVSVNYIYVGGGGSVIRAVGTPDPPRITFTEKFRHTQSLRLAMTHARGLFPSLWAAVVAVQTDVHTSHPCTSSTTHGYR